MARGAWRLPGYRVEELLGAGSSGEVWLGRVNATGAPVALKRIWMSDAAQRRAALSEAAMLSALDHPHLMRLHELRHVGDDAIVLVLDLAAAGSLAALLDRRGRLTVGEVITAVAPIAAALAYAHRAGVVHGDVSAANILFTDAGLPLLADLGVARLLGDAFPVRTTPAYADPCVAAGDLPGPASDVFMLGGVALHALTGTPPWPGAAPAEVLEVAASMQQPDFAGRLAAAGVPANTIAVLVRALSVEPALRATAADLALDLRHSGEPVAVELSAGRSRVVPTLHPATAVRGGGGDGASARNGGASAPLPARPPLTYGVRAPSPFAGARTGRHLARSAPRWATRLVSCVVLVVVALAASIWWWPYRPGHQHRAPTAALRPAVSTAAVSRLPSSSAASSAAPSRPASRARVAGGAAPLDASRARVVLTGLDGTRAAAFAARDPRLLASVYASPALLARDRAMLTSLVPSGCGLHGVRTEFRDLVIVARSADWVRLRVRAAIRPSTLRCGATTSGHAGGSPALAVQVDLVRRGSTYRIAGQHRV